MITPRPLTTALALGAMLTVQACQPITLADGAVTADDPCSRFRATIVQARQTEIDEQANAAATGAIVGGLLGALTGDSDDRGRNAVIGAVAGGLSGFAGAYARQASARAGDSRQLLGVIDGDARREAALVTRTGQAAASLRTCRRQEIAALTRSVRAGSTPPAAARAQLRAVRSRAAADNQVISAAFNGIGQRVDAYVDTTGQVASADRAISAASARRATPSVQRVATQSRQVQTAQVQQSNRVDAELDALEALLG